MERRLPSPIVNEEDLKLYEDYLNDRGCNRQNSQDTADTGGCGYEVWVENDSQIPVSASAGTMLPRNLSDGNFMPGYLKNHIGKLIRVESLIGGSLERRTGTLMQVGADFIVIKLCETCASLVCEAGSIKYITIVHDNDLRGKTGLF